MDLATAKAAVKRYTSYTNWMDDVNADSTSYTQHPNMLQYGTSWQFIVICTVLDDISTRLETLENIGK